MTATYRVRLCVGFVPTTFLFLPAGRGDVFSNVPEAADYTLIYDLSPPENGNFTGGNVIPYTVDNSKTVLLNGFDRVAYYLELVTGTTTNWVYVSMDDFSHESLKAIGLPHSTHNPVAHGGIVHNMNVFAAPGAGVTTGTGIQTGNIEMWPSNYGSGNPHSIPNCTDTHDWGDGGYSTAAGHSSFQIHNHAIPETLLGYNAWGTSRTDALGIGNDPNTPARGGMYRTDWTFADNSATYTARRLQILVRERSSPVDVDAMTATVRSRVSEAAGFELVQDLSIPTGALQFNSKMIPYALDRAGAIMPSVGRVAYYLELDSEWVYVSMDAPTWHTCELGVPALVANGGARFQQILTNMNVFASAGAGVTTGTGIPTGNIEFWERNYSPALGLGGIGGSGSLYDLDDTQSDGGYGSMQIHNHGASQVILAYSGWGDSGRTGCLGIGNQASAHPDWTHNDNADEYEIANLYVLIQAPPPSTQFMIK